MIVYIYLFVHIQIFFFSRKFEAIQLEQKVDTKMVDTDIKTDEKMETRTDVDSDLDR